MNFSKHLLKQYKMCCYLNNAFVCKSKRNINVLSYRNGPIINALRQQKLTKRKIFSKEKLFCSYNTPTITDIEEITGVYPFVDGQPVSRTDIARSVLFHNTNDPIIIDIAKCASVEELFNFVRNNVDKLDYKYLTQIVLTLYDLWENIFIYHYEGQNDEELRGKFYRKLLEHHEFFMVTKALETSLESFNPLFLSYTTLYLNRLGVPEETQLIQNMALQIRNHLLKEFSLSMAARLVRVIFLETGIRPLYLVIDLIPKIFEQIELVENTTDLEDLTVCLYRLYSVLTEDVLFRYETKISQLMKDNILTEDDYQLILKIMSVLNFPMWRNKFCLTTTKCILLMKNSIESLNLMEMYHLYDIFFKNQEPGECLNTIQRSAAKLLHEIDDGGTNQKTKLRLFSSVIYFSSPINKEQFRKDIGKYLSEKETVDSLIILRKMYSYLKISDTKLCDAYWDKACQLLKNEKDFDQITRLMENYLYFCGDLTRYRHYAFEHYILTLIKKQFDSGSLTMFPSWFFSSLTFVMISSFNAKFIERLLQIFKEISTQLTPIDIFKLSHCLQSLRQRKSLAVKSQIEQVKIILHDATARICKYRDIEPATTGLLTKASIMRDDYENDLTDDLMTSMKHPKYMSSKILEYVCFNLLATKTLIPEVVNQCTGYVVHQKNNIIGFNAEKVLGMLYHLNYQPVYEDEFFGTVINILIRDQERLSGLGFLQSALSLCFFNRIPKSFVKQIFNVEFLDKLDVEMASCYYRTRYPQRVRRILMELNRAVCLEYPEYNVPWFHQKYVEEYHKTNAIDDLVTYFHRSVKGYLGGVLGEGAFLENVITPYGYDINFVLHLDKNNKPTYSFDDQSTTKVALLLKHERSFTRRYVRLRGKHALKHRHLEILGYKVKIVNRNDWINLLYAKERVDYINQVVFS